MLFRIFRCLQTHKHFRERYAETDMHYPLQRIINLLRVRRRKHVSLATWRYSGATKTWNKTECTTTLQPQALSEPMMARLLTHISVNRPRWVNTLLSGSTIWGITYTSARWSGVVRYQAITSINVEVLSTRSSRTYLHTFSRPVFLAPMTRMYLTLSLMKYQVRGQCVHSLRPSGEHMGQ